MVNARLQPPRDATCVRKNAMSRRRRVVRIYVARAPSATRGIGAWRGFALRSPFYRQLRFIFPVRPFVSRSSDP
jgi:hypothetical protein